MSTKANIGAAILIGCAAYYLVTAHPVYEAEENTVSQLPYVCGSAKSGMHMVTNYDTSNGLVIDTDHGGVWPEAECKVWE